ncbi:uncharacterized protein BT62DRAFT_371902 [Guyanagaster necrorhizus]|uniref:SET domain-containing protein n=1 Tax=Guyanagaster necrorhizus TaxID=856835 RepID=A0A9P7VLG3_9AGAR|nr:uncharacterized protein BT62DRAFT_371902 [Guyanagaster necrorhizus MCA 3950]KAG7442733.1 hypothetical protein BT62DRAFT_371902 [Guyanagaster necrorhizus MCA 3950]
MLLKSCPADAKGTICRYISISKNLSMVDHSCSPNSHQKFYISSFSMQLCAARGVKEGEETFQLHQNSAANRGARGNLLPYGIKCTCRACLNPTKSDPIHAAVFNCPCVTALMQNPDNTRAGSASGRLNPSCGADCCEDPRGRVTRIARVLQDASPVVQHAYAPER